METQSQVLIVPPRPHPTNSAGPAGSRHAAWSCLRLAANRYFGNPGSCTLNPDNVTCNGAWGMPPRTELVGLDLFSNAPLVCEHNFTAAGAFVCRDFRHNPCPRTWTRQTRGEFAFDGCNAEGQLWSSAVDRNVGNRSFLDPASGKAQMAESVTAVAVGFGPADANHAFVAHRWLNETRVLDKVNGSLIETIPMLGPAALTWCWLGETQHGLFSIEDATNATSESGSPRRQVVRLHTASGRAPYRPTPLVLPGVREPLSIAGTKSPSRWWKYKGFEAGGILVADGADSTVKAYGLTFNGSAYIGTLVNVVGRPGGYADGNPTVEPNRFFWGDGVTTAGGATGIAADDEGCVWVIDNVNRRLVRLNYSTGHPVGEPVSYAPASYCSTVSARNASRVFSNFVEYSVDYDHVATKDPRYPASEGWALVRNWLAGVPNTSLVDFSGAFTGLNSIAEVGGRTFGICNMRRDPAYNHGAGGKVLVELDPTKGMSIVLLLNNTDGQCGQRWCKPGVVNPELKPDGSIVYMNITGSTNWTHDVQQFWKAEFDPAFTRWDFPGTLLATIAGKTNQLRYSSQGNGAASYPQTPDGNLIIFDGVYALNMTWNRHPNQGFHLGKLKTTQSTRRLDNSSSSAGSNPGGAATSSADWIWQASPWGDWNVTDGPPQILGDKRLLLSDGSKTKLCQGYNVSLKVITPETTDGRFGGNSTGIQYGGNLAVNVGEDVVYGFHGEFWKSGEANQFLHFRDGIFMGQFGTPVSECVMIVASRAHGDGSQPRSSGDHRRAIDRPACAVSMPNPPRPHFGILSSYLLSCPRNELLGIALHDELRCNSDDPADWRLEPAGVGWQLDVTGVGGKPEEQGRTVPLPQRRIAARGGAPLEGLGDLVRAAARRTVAGPVAGRAEARARPPDRASRC